MQTCRSPCFINNQQVVELEKPLILITEKKISNIHERGCKIQPRVT
jgi:chaperonin GroEL (HSP60 family)